MILAVAVLAQRLAVLLGSSLSLWRGASPLLSKDINGAINRAQYAI
jgi:hypothetical protein